MIWINVLDFMPVFTYTKEVAIFLHFNWKKGSILNIQEKVRKGIVFCINNYITYFIIRKKIMKQNILNIFQIKSVFSFYV